MKKTVLITGASSGIGKITAMYFHKMGWNVAATMRSPEKETELLEYESLKCIFMDVCQEQTIHSAIKETISVFGSVDVIVNNAGIGTLGPFEAASEDDIKLSFDTNLFGAMKVIRTILPYFRERRKGVIVNVTSRDARMSSPLYSIYNATKWALEGFLESLQYELHQFDIKIKIIEPGPTNTDFYGRSQQVIYNKSLRAYDNYFNLVAPNLQQAGVDGCYPEVVAEKIYLAANDPSKRLRYLSGNGTSFLLWLRGKIPTHWFVKLTRKKFEKANDRLAKYNQRS